MKLFEILKIIEKTAHVQKYISMYTYALQDDASMPEQCTGDCDKMRGNVKDRDRM